MAPQNSSTGIAGHPYAQIKPIDKHTGLINAVIESPKGCRNKYKLDEEHGYFNLHKVLPLGMFFPLDFGFVPGTRAADGDPIDVLIFMDEPTFTGCVAKVRFIGAIKAEQRLVGEPKWTRNDRLLAVSAVSHEHRRLQNIDDLDQGWIAELEHFFVVYNQIQKKEFRILGRGGADLARELLDGATTAMV